jgi:hypothetical protein
VGQTPAAGGKQTIVIASPRPNLPGAPPAKILTMPRGVAGPAGTQYIVVTTRPGGSAVSAGNAAPALTVSPAAGGQRVISKHIFHLLFHLRNDYLDLKHD